MPKTPKKPVVLCILDGWGINPDSANNAPALARTPHFDALMAGYPTAKLITHGAAVGLPNGQFGNSEVGHTHIGAGRVIEMDLVKIDRTIAQDQFASLAGFTRFCHNIKNAGGRAHIIGLLSDGGVHSHIDHLIHAANCLVAQNIEVFLHLITDGRDVAPKSALDYLQKLQNKLAKPVRIATIGGRYYAFDRDNRWERVEIAYRAMAEGKGTVMPSAELAIKTSYTEGVTDEFIIPCVLPDYDGFGANDGLLCLNFRTDRARQILAAIGDKDFNAFETAPLRIISGFASYSKEHDDYVDCLFPKDSVKNTLGEWVAGHGLHQFRLAETEKYPHVTFFLNGGREEPFCGETRRMVPSPAVATYDLQPEMSCPEVSDALCDAIASGQYDLIVVNYANPDMVGHSGVLTAAITACESVDKALGEMMGALDSVGGCAVICADHGNCETMVDTDTGKPHTAHTTNLVPVILFGAGFGRGVEGVALRDGGSLADIAPTVLHLMGIDTPEEMSGECLVISD